MTNPTPEAVLSESEDVIEGLRIIAKYADDEGTCAIHLGFLERVIAALAGRPAVVGAEPVAAAVWSEAARLMRYIDAYAYDYNKLGKVAGSRFEVERELCAALATKGEQAGAVVAWTEDHTMRAINATASFETVRLTSEHGPYDISRPTFKCDRLVEAVIAIRDAQWRNSLVPQPVAANVPMVCAIEINRQGQPYPRTCGLCGLGPCKEPR